MAKKVNDRKYDKKGRLIYDKEPSTGILYKYKYSKDGQSRTVTITNDNNRSNFKTILEQKRVDDNYINILKEEFGDVYNIRVTYDDVGDEIKHEQINKIKKTNLIKEIRKIDGTETEIFIINYKNKESVGFKINPKNLKNGKRKQK